MDKYKNIFIACLFLAAVVFVFYGCLKDKGETELDKQLYREILSSGYTYYQNGNLLQGANASPHGSFKLRYNSIAISVLDSAGELPAGTAFPAGSVIVKEVGSANTIELYAVMKKDPSNKYAGSGWLWAELEPNGLAKFTAVKGGNGCIICHSEIPNRDLVRTFDFH